MAICEVTFLLGFSETTSFNRAFKRWYDLSPGEFRSLQHERKEAALSNNNVVVNQELDSEDADQNILVLNESEKLDLDKNVIVQEELDDKETSNGASTHSFRRTALT